MVVWDLTYGLAARVSPAILRLSMLKAVSLTATLDTVEHLVLGILRLVLNCLSTSSAVVHVR